MVDGEVVVVADDRLKFDALQLRIHPAESRITLLADDIPASLVAFDLLAFDGEDLRSEPFALRRDHLETFVPTLGGAWHLTPSTTDRETALRWFDEF